MTLMRYLTPATWGITTRLVLIATVPSFLLFLVLISLAYISNKAELREDLEHHGSITAGALAQASQYGLVSGNTAYLDATTIQIMNTDQSIVGIEILDASRASVLTAGTIRGPDVSVFERSVEALVPDVNLFSESGPHVALPVQPQTTFRTGRVAGYVRVALSPVPAFAAKRVRLYWSALAAAAASLGCALAGLLLAQRLRAPLHRAMQSLRNIRQGQFALAPDPTATGELGELQTTIVDMARGLQVRRAELEAEVANRTNELQLAVEQLAASDAEKRRLIAQGNSLIEDERQRIALEIHDHLNASLLVVKLDAQHIHDLNAKASHPQGADIAELANRIADTASQLYSSGRSLIKQLRPEVIDTLGIASALAEMVRQFDRMHPTCRVAFDRSPAFPDLQGTLAITAYRVTQEALTNIGKHAHATQARVALGVDPETGGAQVIVEDNGCGFEPEAAGARGLGLIGIKERVFSVGGSVVLRAGLGRGTFLCITLPAGLGAGAN